MQYAILPGHQPKTEEGVVKTKQRSYVTPPSARHSLFKAHIGGGEYTVQTRPLSIEGALERISLSSCHRKFWGWCSQQSRTDNPGLRHFHTGAVVVVVGFVQMAGDGGRNLWKQYNNTDELSADRPLNLKSFKENVSFWLTF